MYPAGWSLRIFRIGLSREKRIVLLLLLTRAGHSGGWGKRLEEGEIVVIDIFI